MSQISEDLLKEKVHQAKKLALNYISKRVCTTGKLREYLSKKGIDKDFVEPIIRYLKKRELLNDAYLANNYVANIIKDKPMSKQNLKYKMKNLGFEDSVISEALKEYSEDEALFYFLSKIKPRIRLIVEENLFEDLNIDDKKIAFFLRKGLTRGFRFYPLKKGILSLIKELRYEMENLKHS